MKSNYDAVRDGLSMKDEDFWFIVPAGASIPEYPKDNGFDRSGVGITPGGNSYVYHHVGSSVYDWCVAMFVLCDFCGAKKSCEDHMHEYPNHNLVGLSGGGMLTDRAWMKK